MTTNRTTLEQLADELDRTLLAALKEGVPVTTEDGEVIKAPPTAAMLNVIRARLKDAGVTSDMTQEESPLAKLAEAARARQGVLGSGAGQMPPLSLADDEATEAA